MTLLDLEADNVAITVTLVDNPMVLTLEVPSDITLSVDPEPARTVLAFPYSMAVPTVTAGTMRLYNDTGRNLFLLSIRGAVGTAPTGADLVFSVLQNGVSATAAPLVISAGTNTCQATTFAHTAWPNGNYLTVNISQVGSVVVGSDFVVTVTAG